MRVYLDHNATAPLRPEAAAAMRAALVGALGNPSSLHEEGRRARALVEAAREQVAALLGARTRDVVFTSGGSEAIAAAVRGVADRAPAGRRKIVVGAIEHSAVLEAAREAGRRGFEVVEIGCDEEGRIDLDAFSRSIDATTALAAVQAANNETGVIQPVAEARASCRAAGVTLLVDAVQAAGKLPVEAATLGDLVAVSGHKIGGPQGAGALVVREGLVLAPLVPGGGQERRRRGGTEAVTAIVGLGAAADAARNARAAEEHRLTRLRDAFEAGLHAMFPEARIHGAGTARLSNTTNFAIPGVDGETLVIALDLRGFAVATGSACASGAIEPSHVIRAMGFDEAAARAAVRVSTGWSTVASDLDAFLDALLAVCAKVAPGRIAR